MENDLVGHPRVPPLIIKIPVDETLNQVSGKKHKKKKKKKRNHEQEDDDRVSKLPKTQTSDDSLDCYKVKSYHHVVLSIWPLVGDATSMATPALVCPCEETMTHQGGLARTISAVAGSTFQDFCKKHVKQYDVASVGGPVVCPGGKSKAGHIICSVVPQGNTYLDDKECREDLRESLTNIFYIAESERFSHIVLPPFGVAAKRDAFSRAPLIDICDGPSRFQGDLPPEVVAEEMVEAFDEFASSDPLWLKSISVVDANESLFLHKLKEMLDSNPRFSKDSDDDVKILDIRTDESKDVKKKRKHRSSKVNNFTVVNVIADEIDTAQGIHDQSSAIDLTVTKPSASATITSSGSIHDVGNFQHDTPAGDKHPSSSTQISDLKVGQADAVDLNSNRKEELLYVDGGLWRYITEKCKGEVADIESRTSSSIVWSGMGDLTEVTVTGGADAQVGEAAHRICQLQQNLEPNIRQDHEPIHDMAIAKSRMGLWQKMHPQYLFTIQNATVEMIGPSKQMFRVMDDIRRHMNPGNQLPPNITPRLLHTVKPRNRGTPTLFPNSEALSIPTHPPAAKWTFSNTPQVVPSPAQTTFTIGHHPGLPEPQHTGPGQVEENDTVPDDIIDLVISSDDRANNTEAATTGPAATDEASHISTDPTQSGFDNITDSQLSLIMLDKPEEKRIIKSMTQSQRKGILDISRSKKIAAHISINDVDHTVAIVGFEPHISRAKGEIYSLFLSVKNEPVEDDRNLERIKKKVNWFWKPNYGPINECSLEVTGLLEEARERGDQQLQLSTPDNLPIVINLTEMRSIDHRVTVFRVPIGDLPRNWTKISDPTQPFVLVQVQDGDDDMDRVLAYVYATNPGLHKSIVKVERIQNYSLYLKYKVHKEEIKRLDPGKNPEKILWHGCPPGAVESICKYGFDRGYSGQTNAARFGKGVYFAIDCRYSAQPHYAQPDASGNQYMFMSQVLTGDYAQGSSDMTVAPTKYGSVRYDSVVDNVHFPSMFIIFKDNQAYPEFVITLRQ